VDHRVQASPQQLQFVVEGLGASRFYVCCECGRLVCDLCYVEGVDMCTDCEETWQTEDLDFL
jgi:hypothetical protein